MRPPKSRRRVFAITSITLLAIGVLLAAIRFMPAVSESELDDARRLLNARAQEAEAIKCSRIPYGEGERLSQAEFEAGLEELAGVCFEAARVAFETELRPLTVGTKTWGWDAPVLEASSASSRLHWIQLLRPAYSPPEDAAEETENSLALAAPQLVERIQAMETAGETCEGLDSFIANAAATGSLCSAYPAHTTRGVRATTSRPRPLRPKAAETASRPANAFGRSRIQLLSIRTPSATRRSRDGGP